MGFFASVPLQYASIIVCLLMIMTRVWCCFCADHSRCLAQSAAKLGFCLAAIQVELWCNILLNILCMCRLMHVPAGLKKKSFQRKQWRQCIMPAQHSIRPSGSPNELSPCGLPCHLTGLRRPRCHDRPLVQQPVGNSLLPLSGTTCMSAGSACVESQHSSQTTAQPRGGGAGQHGSKRRSSTRHFCR
jgi:hypothetical protein